MGANKDNEYLRMIKNTLDKLTNVMSGILDVLHEIAHDIVPNVETPVIALSNNKAAITCATEGATIHYTTDGTTPTAESAVYSSPLTISNSPTVIKVIAVKLNCEDSEVASKEFTIVAKPSITDADGKISMACATDGATIRYTTDGSTPTSESTAYSAAIDDPVDATTFKAKAFKSGMVDSAVETYAFTPAAS